MRTSAELAASLALAARVVLAVVLAGSSIAKLRSHATVRRDMVILVGEAVAPFVANALPLTELLVAVALVAWRTSIPGAVALALIIGFSAVLVRAQARHVPCPCFGATGHAAPVGPWAIVRNGVLAALAVLAIGSPTGASPGTTLAALVGMGAVAALAVRASR